MSTLALKGGERAFTGSYVGWHLYGEADAAGLKAVADSGKIAKGAAVEKFISEFSEFAGTEYVLPVSNGTISLELIYRTLGIGYGDEVIVPSYTFIASISSVLFTGALPVFADIDAETFNIDAKDVEKKITPKTKAVLAVHVGGRPCDLDALKEVCDKHGLYLVEDCAQAIGSRWNGVHVGLIGAMGSFSCQNSKNLTCGEGGLVITKDKELYEKALAVYNGGLESGRYVIPSGYRVAGEMQCAMLSSQLKSLPAQIERRMENVAYLEEKLKDFLFIKNLKKDERITANSTHLHIARLNTALLKDVSRENFLKAVYAEGVPYCSGYCAPCHTAPCLKTPYIEKITGSKINCDGKLLPVTERMSFKEGMWCYHSLFLGPKSDMDMIANVFEKVYAHLDELKNI